VNNLALLVNITDAPSDLEGGDAVFAALLKYDG
jgi:hypothetical protein